MYIEFVSFCILIDKVFLKAGRGSIYDFMNWNNKLYSLSNTSFSHWNHIFGKRSSPNFLYLLCGLNFLWRPWPSIKNKTSEYMRKRMISWRKFLSFTNLVSNKKLWQKHLEIFRLCADSLVLRVEKRYSLKSKRLIKASSA